MRGLGVTRKNVVVMEPIPLFIYYGFTQVDLQRTFPRHQFFMQLEPESAPSGPQSRPAVTGMAQLSEVLSATAAFDNDTGYVIKFLPTHRQLKCRVESDQDKILIFFLFVVTPLLTCSDMYKEWGSLQGFS